MKQRILLFLIIVAVIFFISCTDTNIENVEPSPTPTQPPLVFDEDDVVFELSSISPFFDVNAESRGYNYYNDYTTWRSEVENTFDIKLSINSVYDLNMFSSIYSTMDHEATYFAIRENINNSNIVGLYKIGSLSQLKRLAKEGLILPFDSYLEGNENWNSLPVEYKNALSFDGMTYGLPTITNDMTYVRCFRQDWLDGLHLNLPTNINQFYEVIKAFNYDDPDNDGLNNTIGTNFNNWSGIQDIFASFDARLNPLGQMLPTWNPNTNKWEDSMIKPEMAECLSFLRGCYSEGLIYRTDKPGIGNQFNAGYSGSFCSIGGTMIITAPKNILASRPETKNPVISFIPAMSHIIDENINCYYANYYNLIVLTKNSKYPETTLNTLIDVFIFDKYGSILGKYGAEGGGYEQQGDLIIRKTILADDSRYPYEGPDIYFDIQKTLHSIQTTTDYVHETGDYSGFVSDETYTKYISVLATVKNNPMCYFAPTDIVSPDYTQVLLDKIDFMGSVAGKVINDVILGYASYEEAMIEYRKQASSAGMQEFIDQQNEKLGSISGN